MELRWNTLPRDVWDHWHHRHGGALQQAWAYGQAMAQLGAGVQRAAFYQGERLVGVAQCVTRRWLGYIGLASCSRGPVWAPELRGPERAQALQRLRRSVPLRPWRVTLVSPNATAGELCEGELAGWGQVMTGYSTVQLDLRQGLPALRAGLEAKWRNRLVRAEGTRGLRITVDAQADRLLALLLHERELRQARRFHGLPEAFVTAYIQAHEAPERAFSVASAHLHGQLVGTLLWLHHGRVATYHMGWNHDHGRQHHAHNLLMWASLGALAERGIDTLDLGGVNTHDLPGISRFKLGMGGQVRVLAGTYF